MEQTGTTELKDVKLDGAALSFVETFTIPDGDAEVRIEYKGTLAGDELKLTAPWAILRRRTCGETGHWPRCGRPGSAGRSDCSHRGPRRPRRLPRGRRPGPFQPTWEIARAGLSMPEWFRDAKFGYGRTGLRNASRRKAIGMRGTCISRARRITPTTWRTMVTPRNSVSWRSTLWKAEKWEPEKLMALYKRAGAKYFVALANHHDNFDTYDSKYQPWNSVNVGPKKDIVGTWAKIAARTACASASATTLRTPGTGSNPPTATMSKDRSQECPTMLRLSRRPTARANGGGPGSAGPYCGLRIPMPNDLKTAKDAEAWHWKNDGHWYESVPPNDNAIRTNGFSAPRTRRQISAGPPLL